MKYELFKTDIVKYGILKVQSHLEYHRENDIPVSKDDLVEFQMKLDFLRGLL